MTLRRSFHGTPVNRLIVSVPTPDVEAVDTLLAQQGKKHPARGCRAEFVRLAISEKLARDLRPIRLDDAVMQANIDAAQAARTLSGLGQPNSYLPSGARSDD